jgi:hypothetical protein
VAAHRQYRRRAIFLAGTVLLLAAVALVPLDW